MIHQQRVPTTYVHCVGNIDDPGDTAEPRRVECAAYRRHSL